MNPQEMVRVQTYLRKVFGAKTLSVRARPKIKDFGRGLRRRGLRRHAHASTTRTASSATSSRWRSSSSTSRTCESPETRRADARSTSSTAHAWRCRPTDAYWVGRQRARARQGRSRKTSASGSASWLRGDNEPIVIGARTQRAGRLRAAHRSGFPLSSGDRSGHASATWPMLHGCTIGRGALIGIGAIVLNGARIGARLPDRRRRRDPEGKEIPHSLGGVSARPARSSRHGTASRSWSASAGAWQLYVEPAGRLARGYQARSR